MKKKNTVWITFSWVLVAACMAVIFCLSAQEASESSELSGWLTRLLIGLPEAEKYIRKAAHALEFMGLAVLMFNALRATCGYNRPYFSFILTVLYAATDEFHQLFVEGRACRLFDVGVDSLGAAAGIIAVSVLALIIEKNKRRKLQ